MGINHCISLFWCYLDLNQPTGSVRSPAASAASLTCASYALARGATLNPAQPLLSAFDYRCSFFQYSQCAAHVYQPQKILPEKGLCSNRQPLTQELNKDYTKRRIDKKIPKKRIEKSLHEADGEKTEQQESRKRSLEEALGMRPFITPIGNHRLGKGSFSTSLKERLIWADVTLRYEVPKPI